MLPLPWHRSARPAFLGGLGRLVRHVDNPDKFDSLDKFDKNFIFSNYLSKIFQFEQFTDKRSRINASSPLAQISKARVLRWAR